MDLSQYKINLPEMILIALMSALNVGFDLIISIPFKLLLGHIIAGIFIMVPINFIFLIFTKFIVDKPGSLSIYLLIFSILSIPTSMFGGTAGAYKIVVGGVIGILLDFSFFSKKLVIKLIVGSIIAAVIWWIALFTVWQLFQLPFVTGFSNMMNSASALFTESIDLSSIISLPITQFGLPFFQFAILCGLMSAGPCLIASFVGYYLFNTIRKTAIYEKFKSFQ